MKKVFTLLKLILFTMTIALILIFALVPFMGQARDSKSNAHLEVFITYNEIHTGITFPISKVENLLELFPEQKSFQAKFVEFSFGDRDFFIKVPTWDKLTAKVLVNALFSSKSGIMHVDMMKELPSKHKKILLNEDQFKALIAQIKESFAIVDNKARPFGEHSYYGSDRFYESTHNYHLFFTCNNWTGQLLNDVMVQKTYFTPYRDSVLKNLP